MSVSDTVRLKLLGLPIIKSLEDLSALTRLSQSIIYQLSAQAKRHYKSYEIPKKSGGLRTISQPSRRLKGLQSWLLVNVLNKLTTSSACKGFQIGESTYHNAQVHVGASSILTVDIESFFDSVSKKQVFNIFKAVGYNDLIATIFSNIATNDGKLPQGSPCSPKLANLSVWRLDARLQGYVNKRGINYSRYADDLTFSSSIPSELVHTLPFIKYLISSEKFSLNDAKTRLMGPSKAKIVTGLIVQNDSVGIGAEKYKYLRAKIHRLTKPTEQTNIKLLNEVRGWLSYLNSVDVKRLNKAKKYIDNLQDKNPTTLVAKLI